ncbi:hypothetical protein [Serpentinimonas maccroryi]|uniref:hypothetical protein n=1 Tax=Serpentinimonas maccroryi TaxID=1458426 RepID=UPI0020345454|nr:hypothetical protein [Serpentinimonas maccroryi]MCM2480206.1 hypothetical protein [Serpentinimonas maccroryi]
MLNLVGWVLVCALLSVGLLLLLVWVLAHPWLLLVLLGWLVAIVAAACYTTFKPRP